MPDRYEPLPDMAAFNQKVDRTCESIDDTMQVLINQAKAQRRYALLQAATLILYSPEFRSPAAQTPYLAAIDYAEQMLAEIERREK